MQKQWRMLIVTSLAVVCSLTSWFAATAVLNNFSEAIGISLQQGSWLTSAVQLGFVTGALGSSFLALTDTVSLTRILTVASLLAAASTALLLTRTCFRVGTGTSIYNRNGSRWRLPHVTKIDCHLV